MHNQILGENQSSICREILRAVMNVYVAPSVSLARGYQIESLKKSVINHVPRARKLLEFQRRE